MSVPADVDSSAAVGVSVAGQEPLHSAGRAHNDRIAASSRCICRRDGLLAPVQ